MPDSLNGRKIRLASRVRHRAVGEDGVLVHLDSGRVIVVNEVGLFIVQQLEQAMTREELVSSVAAEFDISADRAASDLDLYLGELDDEQLLERPA